MKNPNAGKKAFIPLGTHSASAVTKQEDAIMQNIKQATGSADFSRPSKEKSKKVPASPTPKAAPVERSNKPGRKPDPNRITKCKGIYFEEPIFNTLMKMQLEGQNVSRIVNELVKEKLGL